MKNRGERIPDKINICNNDKWDFGFAKEFILFRPKYFLVIKREGMKKDALLMFLVVLAVVAGSFQKVSGQDMALKTNLLYDATTTINLGYEVAINKKTTLDIWVNYNPWTLGHK